MKTPYLLLISLIIFSCNPKKENTTDISACITLDYNKRIIYSGIDNLVKISSSTKNNEDIVVKFNNKVVKEPKFDNYYSIQYNNTRYNENKDVILEVFYKNKETGLEESIAKTEFSVQEIPSPEPSFAFQPTGSIVSKEIFKVGKTLDVKLPMSYIVSWQPTVFSFDIEIIQDGKILSLPSDANRISLKQFDAIKKCKKNDVLFFRNVKINSLNNIARIRDFVYVIE